MKRIYLLLLTGILSFSFYSCSTIKTAYDYDRTANFESYKTYSIDKEALNKLQLNDLDKNRIISEVTTQMNAKNFQLQEKESDLIISIHAMSKEHTDYNQSVGVGFGGWWPWMWGGINNTWVNQYEVGTLTFDIIDAKKNVLIWQGVSSGIMVENLESKAEQIQEAIQKAFENFPPEK
ncbi:MAG: DUF4136 domain-containing protein [Flavobacteriales bacterium]|nr:DUF4136 domain-containing protein [Flavobacteriales bacterium]